VTAAERARRSAAALLAGDRMAALLGVEVVDVGPGRATVRMRITEGILADIAYGIACNTHGRVTVSRSAEVIHIAPAHEGEVLVAVARERSRRGRNGIYDVTVERDDGVVVAEFRAQSRTLDRLHDGVTEDGAA
jgi:acyl-CoA thioesterase